MKLANCRGNKFAIIIDEAHSNKSGNTAGKLNETLAKDFEKVKVDDDEFVFCGQRPI